MSEPKTLQSILEYVENDIAEIILRYVSVDKVGWIMDDIAYILYSHAQNDIEALYEEKTLELKKELKYVTSLAENLIEGEYSGTRYYESYMIELQKAKHLVGED